VAFVKFTTQEKRNEELERDTPGGGLICLGVVGCVTHKHFVEIDPFPNHFVARVGVVRK
jgi:hypothetical protein